MCCVFIVYIQSECDNSQRIDEVMCLRRFTWGSRITEPHKQIERGVREQVGREREGDKQKREREAKQEKQEKKLMQSTRTQ